MLLNDIQMNTVNNFIKQFTIVCIIDLIISITIRINLLAHEMIVCKNNDKS